MRRTFLVGPLYDVGWFLVPGVLAIAVALSLPPWMAEHGGDSTLSYLALVLLIDVAHVWSCLYRTYLDPDQRQSHGARLWVIPTACLISAFALHRYDALMMWRVLAYVAIFHFIKQHIGIATIYSRLAQESDFDRVLSKITIWSTTLGAVIWWHSALPRRFAWFMQGDLIGGVPSWMGWWACALAGVAVTLFTLRRAMLYLLAQPQGTMVTALTLLTAASWYVGIVHLDSDLAFTLTNVVIHGVSYLALVYLAGGGQWVERWILERDAASTVVPEHAQTESVWNTLIPTRTDTTPPAPERLPRALLTALIFYGLLVLLAVLEETSWDRGVWHDHPELFGASQVSLTGVAQSILVALLTLPQATHYVLDRYIWRAGSDNPRLAAQLGLGSATASAPPSAQ